MSGGCPRPTLHLIAALLALAAASGAHAAEPPARVREPERLPVTLFDLPPQSARAPSMLSAPRWQRPVPPLDAARMQRLRRAIDMRLGGLPERACDSLLALDREVPHHPQIVVELAQAELAAGREADVVGRLRTLRATLRDSLAGSRELAQALELTGRPREAAAVAVETWTAVPAEGPWANALLLRLAPADPRGVTQALREVLARRPDRGDLARGLAFLLSRQGQAVGAVGVLAAAERFSPRASLRRLFADEALTTGQRLDSLAAREAMLAVAADSTLQLPVRFDATLRVLDLDGDNDERRDDGAIRLARALADVAPARWGPDLLLTLSRRLRDAGRAAQAAALLAGGGAAMARHPELALERALAVARSEGPARAIPALDSLAGRWPAARFAFAEALFWNGETDSALANYRRASEDTGSPNALPALERAYLIEDAASARELTVIGAIAWERWRGGVARARALADSLWTVTPRSSPLYAQIALQAHDARAAAGDWNSALAPVLAVADSLPGDRQAPLARQRAGETYLRLGDDRRALAQFEECLARYPKAWNSAEVRRQVERLRKERRL